MNNRDQVLVIVEPDKHPEQVLTRAAWIAALDGVGVTLVWCDPDIGAIGTPFFVSNEARDIGDRILGAQKVIIDELAVPVRDKGLSVATRVLQERPIADGILRLVEELNPAYVVKGTEFHAAADRSIFVDTDWQLMRYCPCPLWLVKSTALKEQPVIVAAVDPAHSHDKPAALDQAIVAQAKGIAGKSGGEVHLLHSYDKMAGIGAAAMRTFKPVRIAMDDIGQEMSAEHLAKLVNLASSNEIDSENMHQVQGAAREAIPMFARKLDADVVVMGALARWGVKRAIIGSTAERVLDQLPCDILIVRPDNADS